MSVHSPTFHKDSYGSFTSVPTIAGSSYTIINATDRYYLKVVAFALVISVTAIIIMFVLGRMLAKMCGPKETANESYVTVPRDEIVTSSGRNYGSQLSRQSELSHVVDLHPNTTQPSSLWNGSEYDNLSLNPAVGDSEEEEPPPEYEHPPPYE